MSLLVPSSTSVCAQPALRKCTAIVNAWSYCTYCMFSAFDSLVNLLQIYVHAFILCFVLLLDLDQLVDIFFTY